MNVTKVAILGAGNGRNIPTLNIDAIITLGSSLLKTDFYKEGLTLEKLEFEGLNKSQLKQAVQ